MKNTTDHTRRAILGGAIIALPVIAAAAGIGDHAPSAQGTERRAATPALTSLIKQFRHADAKSRKYEAAAEPLRQRWLAVRETVPHIEVPGMPSYDGRATIWSTEDRMRVKNAIVMSKRRVSFHGPGSEKAHEYHLKIRKLAAAGKWRERQIKRAEDALGFAPIYEKICKLSEVVVDLCDQIVAYTCESLADLDTKLRFLNETNGFDADAVPSIIMADVSRLLKKEA